MYLTVLNQTSEPITLTTTLDHIYRLPPSQRVHIFPGLSALSPSFSLSTDYDTDDTKSAEHTLLEPSYRVSARSAILKTVKGSSWKVLRASEGCPWRIYRERISRRHHQVLILPHRNLSSFLSELPDSLPLSALALPGTHDSMSIYGWPIAQCQFPHNPLEKQLHDGIRVVDIRLAAINGALIAYHGIYPEQTPFRAVLAALHAFLSNPPTNREMVVVSIKQENFTSVPPPVFSALVRKEMEEVQGGLGWWFLENRVPCLGEVRGKAVLFSRFGGDGAGWEGGLEGMGIHPGFWPDSEKRGFAWMCKETVVFTHDWYDLPSFLSIPEKVALASSILLPLPKETELAVPALKISYFSAAAFPLSLPTFIARGFGWPKMGMGVEGVNVRFGRWLLGLLAGGSEGNRAEAVERRAESTEGHVATGEPRVRGWALMDYYSDPEVDGAVPLLVECNFRGRVPGEEGW